MAKEFVIIHQIKKDAPDRHYKIFEPYERLIKFYGKVDMNDYEVVYVGEVEANGLDDVYCIFNTAHPPGFRGHSLSVSDIVWFKDKMYYCNDIGWKEM